MRGEGGGGRALTATAAVVSSGCAPSSTSSVRMSSGKYMVGIVSTPNSDVRALAPAACDWHGAARPHAVLVRLGEVFAMPVT
jgi:hypothetical protein